jgi:hypothetical protein
LRGDHTLDKFPSVASILLSKYENAKKLLHEIGCANEPLLSAYSINIICLWFNYRLDNLIFLASVTSILLLMYEKTMKICLLYKYYMSMVNYRWDRIIFLDNFPLKAIILLVERGSYFRQICISGFNFVIKVWKCNLKLLYEIGCVYEPLLSDHSEKLYVYESTIDEIVWYFRQLSICDITFTFNIWKMLKNYYTILHVCLIHLWGPSL